MDPALQGETSEHDENEPTEGAVQCGPGKRAEDGVGDEGFVKARAGREVGRRHLIEWYAGKRLFRHVVGKDKL
jgi:hypothetical protein